MILPFLLAALAGQPAINCSLPRQTPRQASQILIDGEEFTRLSAQQLSAVIVGKSIEEAPPARGYPPWKTIFREGGIAAYFEDRGDWETTYQISSDVIRLDYPGGLSEQLAFFQSADGEIAMGIIDKAGCMFVERVVVEEAAE